MSPHPATRPPAHTLPHTTAPTWSAHGHPTPVGLHALAWAATFGFYPVASLLHLFVRMPLPVVVLSCCIGVLLIFISLTLKSRLLALCALTNLLVIPLTILSLVYFF